MWTLANILWTVAVILVALWLIGLVLGWAAGSSLIHILLVVAVIVIIYNVVMGRRAV